MELTSRETWTVIHGLILGVVFLLAFSGGRERPSNARSTSIGCW